MYFACMHILNIYSFFFFNPHISTLLSSLSSATYQGSNIDCFLCFDCYVPAHQFSQWLIKQMDSFFFPPVYTEITVFHPFGIFPYRKQALKCSPLLVHEEIAVAFQSQHGVVFHQQSSRHAGFCCVLLFWTFYSCAFLFPILSHFFFSCR